MNEKKRYWLKLDKDFLKSNHIKVIKAMPNGKDYIIFYLSLMLESVETIGHLRFNELVPYNPEMLSTITDTNVDIVKNAVVLFKELGLMEILDDGTIYMTQVAAMTGKECESAERVRLFRDRKLLSDKKLDKEESKALLCNEDVTICNDNKEKQSIEIINKKENLDKSKLAQAPLIEVPKEDKRKPEIDYLINLFKEKTDFNPIDQKPRFVAHNFHQKVCKIYKEANAKDFTLEGYQLLCDKFFDWYFNLYKNLSTQRLKTVTDKFDIFIAERRKEKRI